MRAARQSARWACGQSATTLRISFVALSLQRSCATRAVQSSVVDLLDLLFGRYRAVRYEYRMHTDHSERPRPARPPLRTYLMAQAVITEPRGRGSKALPPKKFFAMRDFMMNVHPSLRRYAV